MLKILRLSAARLLIMRKIIVILSLFIASVQLAGAAIQPVENLAYVEPQLNTAAGDSLSLIVTASESQQAARAVRALGGQVVSDLWLIDAVSANVPADQLATLAAEPGIASIVANKAVESAQDPLDENGWVTDYRFPVPWDGSPDVQSSTSRWMYDLVYPTVIDVGADVYQNGSYPLTTSGVGIQGQGVTIAVVDSGVYFSDEVKKTLGSWVTDQFQGQADFVGSGLCPETDSPATNGTIVQQSGFCWTDYRTSRDPYGHGTHVAGIIWNNFQDETSWAYMGVARRSDILSVRVLGNDGTGTYEDVIEGIQYVVANKDTTTISGS
jgi:subtilisin family serine protease